MYKTNTDPEKSKTKCIIFAKKIKQSFKPANILLNGDRLPWVTTVKHLGHTLQSDNSMKRDIAQKRGAFIGKVNSLLQEFHHVSASVFIKLVNTYATSLYGSNTWDIFSTDSERLYSSYNVTIRHALNIDRCSHRYLIQPLSGCLHLKTMIASRFVTFYNSLINTKKTPVRFLARIRENDQRTVLGRTLAALRLHCKVDENSMLSAMLVKKNLVYKNVPEDEAWRIPLSQELLKCREGVLEAPGFTSDELDDILRHSCVS
jgi:hypothetical protein